MTSAEPTGYENEPEEHFLPLPAELYCHFFDLEMGNQQNDCVYYRKILNEQSCQSVLELGCGTGRIVEYLNASGLRAIGIDTSPEMLNFKREHRSSPVAEMDMCRLGFRQAFDAVIIPHNTLSLIGDEYKITHCLEQIKSSLLKNGFLAVHLFAVTDNLKRQAHKRLFQFALFDTAEGGKLVKETIKIYYPQTNQIVLEERYKIRSFENRSQNRNYTQTLPLSVYSTPKWLELIEHSGYAIYSVHSGYNSEPADFSNDSNILISAHRR